MKDFLHNQYVVLFDTTTNALTFESFAKKHDVPGRIVPVPGNLKPGCGLCWKTEISNEKHINIFIEKFISFKVDVKKIS